MDNSIDELEQYKRTRGQTLASLFLQIFKQQTKQITNMNQSLDKATARTALPYMKAPILESNIF